MTVTLPHHASGGALSKRRQHHLRFSAFDLCGCIQRALLATRLGADTACKSRNSFADALFTQGLMRWS
jgi:hypothetical protein